VLPWAGGGVGEGKWETEAYHTAQHITLTLPPHSALGWVWVWVRVRQIASAVLTMLEQEKSVLEGSGAAALATLLAPTAPLRHKLAGQNVGVVCSGGNIDLTVLGRVIEKGLVKSGRLARVRVSVGDTPGELAK
jgi:threonine dehydratase